MYVLFAFLCNSFNFQFTLVFGRSYTGCEQRTCVLPRVVDVSSLSSPLLSSPLLSSPAGEQYFSVEDYEVFGLAT